MPQQRLVLLCLLCAVAGGCSIWYTKMILPASVAPAPVETTPVAATPAEPVVVAAKPKDAEPAKPSTLDKISDAIGATALADDLAAIAESADAIYDDGSLEAQVKNSEPASLTTAYGI